VDDVEEEEWPPREARVQSALWRGEGHLERGEWLHAYRTLEEAATAATGPDDRELARGLMHLAACGYKRHEGDERGAARQLAHARRRLAPYASGRRGVDVAALLDRVTGNPPP
jgi:hypothetical protein